MSEKSQNISENEKHYSDPVEAVREALAKLQYGTIQLTVHQGKLVEISVTERQRFDG